MRASIALIVAASSFTAVAWAAAAALCEDSASCQAKVASLMNSFQENADSMQGSQHKLQALAGLRSGVLAGERVEMPSAQRQYLERGAPLITEFTHDARHKPVTTNVSQHFIPRRSLAQGSKVKFHSFVSVKRSSPAAPKNGVSAVLAIIDEDDTFSVHSLDGSVLSEKLDLHHGQGRKILHTSIMQSGDSYVLATGDDAGFVRVHTFKIGEKAAPATNAEDDSEPKKGKKAAKPKPVTVVNTTFTVGFEMPEAGPGEVRHLTALIPVDRGSQMYFVVGDSIGGISVFTRNGTIKGRARVTEDPGGVVGLLRGQSQSVLFYSSHAFGFFSITQVDVQYQPCSGWNAPLVDIAMDPSSQYAKVVLALADGDVLVFSTVKGKSKTCDLSLKFPHVSTLPFKLYMVKAYVLGLPVSLPGVADSRQRELFLFNLNIMERGYGTAPSRAVAVQASFKPLQPEALTLALPPSGGGGSGGGSGGGKEAVKPLLALRFSGRPGLELYEVNLKFPQTRGKSESSGGGLFGDDGSGSGSSIMDWIPKTGVFGIALMGVLMWNMKKASSGKKFDRGGGGKGGLDDDMMGGMGGDFDSDAFMDKIKERRQQKAAEGGGAGSSFD